MDFRVRSTPLPPSCVTPGNELPNLCEPQLHMCQMTIVMPICQAVLCRATMSLRQEKKKLYIYLPDFEPSGEKFVKAR